MKLYFYGGAKCVTGANYLLEIEGNPSTDSTSSPQASLPPEARLAKGGRARKILIDCGMFQGLPEIEKRNKQDFPYDPKEIDFVLITHAHLDHVGRLPRLIKEGYNGQIFATGPTVDFTRLILEDSQKILEEKARKEGIIPLFDAKEIEKIMDDFKKVEYDSPFELADGVKVCFREAGHVLGSAIIEIEVSARGGSLPDSASHRPARLTAQACRARQAGAFSGSEKRLDDREKKVKIVFSGDLGYHPVPFLRQPAQLEDADYLIVESTYGDRKHESLQRSESIIEDTVEEIAAKKGVLLIPSFALERTQRILYYFNSLVERKKIPRMPVFIDSPLALKITEVYKRYPQYYDQEAMALINAGDDIFNFPGLNLSYTSRQSKEILHVPPPKIIIAGSGMSHGGRIMHHEANYLADPDNILLIVSYQAEGTIGRQLLEGAKKVEINDQLIPVRAKIRHISGYSSHADSGQVFKWVAQAKNTLKKVFVVQGEEKSANALAQNIRDHLGIPVDVPEMGQMAEL